MRLFSLSLNRLLLLTTFLFTPSLALAQEVAETDDGEIVVLGVNIPEPMRETSEVAAFLSSEDLARQGDDNAALALTRLTGLTVDQGGRYVYVRGLGDRYSSALLNGSPLPSPDPLRRQVPLDLFPSNILDGATVQKTFSVNYPGEFGGGIIDLNTLRMPNESFFTIKAGTSFNTESTNEQGLTYSGGGIDWLGFGGSHRRMPGPLGEALLQNQRINDANFTPAQLEVIGESLVNSPLTVIQSADMEPDFEGEITAGTVLDMGRFDLGLIGVFGYDSSIRTRNAERVTVAGGAIATDIDSISTTWDVVTNAFGSATLGWDDSQISVTGLLVRSSSKDAQIDEGTNINDPGGSSRHTESTAWYERQLSSIQFAGDHSFNNLNLDIDWRAAFAQSERDAPYERSITYFVPPGGVEEYAGAGNNVTRFSELTDEVASVGLDAAYTVPLSDQREATFSAGVAYSNAVRWYELLSFSFTGPATATTPDVLQARPDYLFSPDNIDPLRFELHEFTGRDDMYKARMTQSAAYLAADVEILPLIRAAVGVRYEEATQIVRTGNRFGETPSAPVEIDEDYWLPAATFTWNFAEDTQLRLGYSQTVARPQFRELALTPYLDPETDRVFQGNPALVNTEFRNYDARLEYYFGRDQFITGGLFYKEVTDPIEEVIVLGGDGTSTLTRFINAPEATLYGVELEYRTRFDMPFEVPFLNSPEWMFAVNYTYTSSEVSADASDTVINPVDGLPAPASVFGLDGSQLQGTPEHIANLQFGYDTEFSQLTLLVGWVDERIARRGLGALPEVIEDPGVNVDLVYRREFDFAGTPVTLGLSGRNLLNEDHIEYQESVLGSTNINSYERGRSFSVSMTARY